MNLTFLRLIGVVWLLVAYTPAISQNTYRWLLKADLEHLHGLEILEFVKSKINGTNIYLLETRSGFSTAESELNRLKRLYPYLNELYIQPDYVYVLTDLPNDSLFNQQTNLLNQGQNACLSGIDIHIEEGWNITKGDSNQVIIVIDGGMDTAHLDLHPNLWNNPFEIPGDGIDNDNNGYIDDVHGWDFVNDSIHSGNVFYSSVVKGGGENPKDDTRNGHGTHVSGIIGAKGDNAIGISGVCWDCKIMPLKFADSTSRGSSFAAIEAIEYAISMKAKGIDITVINNSWGGGHYDPLLKDAIRRADSAGILFVAAAGNITGNNNDSSPFYPASYDLKNIISVIAADCEGKLADFSCFGRSTADIVAPGDGILSTLPANRYGTLSGTSMAAPHVSGTIALIASYMDNLSHEGIKNLLLSNTQSSPHFIEKCITEGYLNVHQALLGIPQRYRDLPADFMSYNFSMVADSCGAAIWLGEQIGQKDILIRIDPVLQSRDTFLLPPDTSTLPLGRGEGKEIVIAPDGKVWIAFEHELYTFDIASQDWTLISSSLGVGKFEHISISPIGNIWASIGNDKLLTAFIQTIGVTGWDTLQLGANNAYLDYRIRSIQTNTNDLLYVMADFARYDSTSIPGGILLEEGTAIIKYGSGVFYTLTQWADSLIDSNTNFPLLIDAQEKIWIGGLNEQIAHFDGVNWRNYAMSTLGLSAETIEAISADKHGNLWFGTENSGLIQYDGINWIHHGDLSQAYSWSSNSIKDIVADIYGDVWISFRDTTTITKLAVNTQAAFEFQTSSICKGATITVKNTSLKADSFKWEITKDLILQDTSHQKNLIYTFNEAGFYRIELIAYKDSVSASSAAYLYVQGPIDLNLGSDTTSQADVVYLKPDIPLMRDYLWTYNDILIGQGANCTADSTGTYILAIEDYCGNISQDTIVVTLNGNGKYVILGDVTRDGRFNAEDFLYLATVAGQRGHGRDSILDTNNIYQSPPKASQPWNTSLPTYPNIDLSLIDMNGDSTINLSTDALFTKVLANSTHSSSNMINNFGLVVDMDIQYMPPSDTIDIVFNLEGSPKLMNRVYGIAISVYLNQALKKDPIVPTEMNWLGTFNQNVYRDFIFDRDEQRIDFIFTRTDRKQPMIPNPNLRRRRIGGGCTIAIIEDIDTTGLQSSSIPLTYTLGNILILDRYGNQLPIHSIFSQSVHTLNLPTSSVAPINIQRKSPGTPSFNFSKKPSLFNTYPNPNRGVLNTQVENEYTLNLIGELFDLSGRKVKTYQNVIQAGHHQVTWNLADLPDGVYILRYRNEAELLHQEKIILIPK